MHVCIYKKKTISLYTSNASDSDVLSSRSRNHSSSWHLKQTTQHPLKAADLKIARRLCLGVRTYFSTWHLMLGDCCVMSWCTVRSNSLQKQVFLQCYHFYTGRERHTVTWQNVITPFIIKAVYNGNSRWNAPSVGGHPVSIWRWTLLVHLK